MYFGVVLFFFLFASTFGEILESVKTNCPPPSAGCRKVSERVVERGCREINGQRVCRNWWRKEVTYRCEGRTSELVHLFTSGEYCGWERVCTKYMDVREAGGVVSCRVFLDHNKPGCAKNPSPECWNSDCGNIPKLCTFLKAVPYENIYDRRNQVVSASQMTVLTFKCPPAVRKVCLREELRKVCPDGKVSRVCEITSVCKEWKEEKQTVEIARETTARRLYKTFYAIKGSRRAKSLRSNPLCVKVGERTRDVLTYGWYSIGFDGDYGNCGYMVQGGPFAWMPPPRCDVSSMEVYATGMYLEEPDLEKPKVVRCGFIARSPFVERVRKCDDCLGCGSEGHGCWYERWFLKPPCKKGIPHADYCVKEPPKSKLIGWFNKYLQINGLRDAAVVQDVLYDERQRMGTHANPYDGECFGDDGGPSDNTDFRIPVKLAVVEEIYRCYRDKLSYSVAKGCRKAAEPDTTELVCVRWDRSVDDPNKAVCSAYALPLLCKEEQTRTVCAKFEKVERCTGGDITVPEVITKGEDFAKDFGKALGTSAFLNELRHIWSGQPKLCESGWWSSFFQNPLEYFKDRLVSYAITYAVSSGLSFATEQVVRVAGSLSTATSSCLSPSIANFSTCFTSVAGDQYKNYSKEDQEIAYSLLCGEQGSGPLCSAAKILSSPWGAFAITTAIDILSSIDRCSTCSSEKCARKHGDLREHILINKGLCRYIGSKCTWKIDLGIAEICLRRGYRYCCYDSTIGKFLVEEAYRQLGKGWGTFDRPNCSGITFEEMKKLDFEKMDLSKLERELRKRMDIPEGGEFEEIIKDFYQGGAE